MSHLEVTFATFYAFFTVLDTLCTLDSVVFSSWHKLSRLFDLPFFSNGHYKIQHRSHQAYLKRHNVANPASLMNKHLCVSVSLSFRYRINVFSRHPQLPRPDAGWAGHLMGAHVCHCHVVSQEIPTPDVQEGSVCWPVWRHSGITAFLEA